MMCLSSDGFFPLSARIFSLFFFTVMYNVYKQMPILLDLPVKTSHLSILRCVIDIDVGNNVVSTTKHFRDFSDG